MLEKIKKARRWLILDQPFWGVACTALELKEDSAIETMTTDGEVIYYNSSFVDKLSVQQLKGVLAHGVAHCLNLHHVRKGSRNDNKWNRACDYAINGILVDSGFELPKGALINSKFDDMAAERIYTLLPDEPEKGYSNFGAVKTGTGKNASAAEVQKQTEKWQQIAANASISQRKSAGRDGADFISKIKASQCPLPASEILQNFVSVLSKNDYSWQRPNRRYIGYGTYLPSLHSYDVGKVLIVVDTSASIEDKDLAVTSALINDALSEFKGINLTVLAADTEVKDEINLTAEDFPIDLSYKGRGGTDFNGAFDYISKMDEKPVICVFVTDGCTWAPVKEKPEYPVLWLGTQVFKPEFGEFVYIYD